MGSMAGVAIVARLGCADLSAARAHDKMPTAHPAGGGGVGVRLPTVNPRFRKSNKWLEMENLHPTS
jgi:hypothetical protein